MQQHRFASCQRERKRNTKHKHFGGIIPGLDGGRKVLNALLGPSSFGEEENTTKSKENPVTTPEDVF